MCARAEAGESSQSVAVSRLTLSSMCTYVGYNNTMFFPAHKCVCVCVCVVRAFFVCVRACVCVTLSASTEAKYLGTMCGFALIGLSFCVFLLFCLLRSLLSGCGRISELPVAGFYLYSLRFMFWPLFNFRACPALAHVPCPEPAMFSCRVLLQVLAVLACFGCVILVDFTFLPFDYTEAQYITGVTLVFVALQAHEGVIMSVTSKVIPRELAR